MGIKEHQEGSAWSRNYSESHCYQYDIRLKNYKRDLEELGLSETDVERLKIEDFNFSFVPPTDKWTCDKIKEFIERHEWLGKMPTRPTHRFIATYQGRIAGAIVMATPNTISNILGKEHRHQEKLISRGACISWSPKNLGSSLIMFAVRWMAKNTEFRYFTAYSDVEARELGTIYQACNFIYLGQSSGARFECLDPNRPELGYFSDRILRRASFIKRKTLEAGIEWNSAWQDRERVLWDQIPDETRAKIDAVLQAYKDSIIERKLPYKHKYVYILGPTKKETDGLRAKFIDLNPSKAGLKYPKNRGPTIVEEVNQAPDNSLAWPCRVPPEELTKRPNPCWPIDMEPLVPLKKFRSIKEVATMYGISTWLIYHHIKTDPTFPAVNIGLKKRFLIDIIKLESWLNEKTKTFNQSEHRLPSVAQLLEVK